MPSRPVLIGRGLVPTPYKTTHAPPSLVRTTPRKKRTTTLNTHSHRVAEELFASTKQIPTNKPPNWFVRVERVTAAIAKRETPGPIPNPEVKPFSADGTATERLWESRTPPDKH